MSEITAKSTWKMFKWKNKSFPIFLMSQYQFQYQLSGQLVSTRIWIRPVLNSYSAFVDFFKVIKPQERTTVNEVPLERQFTGSDKRLLAIIAK